MQTTFAIIKVLGNLETYNNAYQNHRIEWNMQIILQFQLLLLKELHMYIFLA